MEKTLENDMETGFIQEVVRDNYPYSGLNCM